MMIRFSIHILITILLGCLLSSIQHSKGRVEPDVYLKEYQENRENFIRRKTIDNVRYSVQVVPNALKLIHLDKRGVVTSENISEFNQETENTLEFLFQIDLLDYREEFLTYPLDNSMNYTERLEYFSFNMKDDISILLDGKYTLKCQDYVFERNFGSSPKASITIGFNLPKKYKTLKLIISDKVFNNDNIQFEFSSNQLNILPKLKKYNKWKK